MSRSRGVDTPWVIFVMVKAAGKKRAKIPRRRDLQPLPYPATDLARNMRPVSGTIGCRNQQRRNHSGEAAGKIMVQRRPAECSSYATSAPS